MAAVSAAPPSSATTASPPALAAIEVFAPAAQRFPWFQVVDSADPQFYEKIIKVASASLKENYKEFYEELPATMDRITKDWTYKKDTATEGNLEEVAKQAAEYQELYSNAKKALQTIREAYENAIANCNPPPLAPETLKYLKKIGVDVEKIESLYVEVFDTQPKLLEAQQSKMIVLSTKIETSYRNMKQAMEVVTARLKSKLPAVLNSMLDLCGRRTPYLDALRDEYRKKIAEAQAASDNKETP